jgi:Protein of unknown function (DUF3562)
LFPYKIPACLKLDKTMTSANRIQLKPEHLDVIETLAEETSRPLEEVRKIYAETLVVLSSEARIQDYLVVLTSKKVLDRLRQTEVGRREVSPHSA